MARGLKGSRKQALTSVCSWSTRNGPGNGWMWSRPEWGQHIKGTDGSQRSWKGIGNADWAFSETKKNQVNRLIKEWHHLLRQNTEERKRFIDLFICEDASGGRDRMGSGVRQTDSDSLGEAQSRGWVGCGETTREVWGRDGDLGEGSPEEQREKVRKESMCSQRRGRTQKTKCLFPNWFQIFNSKILQIF